jgi:hypothetical protein
MASAERRSIGLINARVVDMQRPDTHFYRPLQSLTYCAYRTCLAGGVPKGEFCSREIRRLREQRRLAGVLHLWGKLPVDLAGFCISLVHGMRSLR